MLANYYLAELVITHFVLLWWISCWCYIHNKSADTNLEVAFQVIALRYSAAEFLHNGSHILMPYAVSIIIIFDVCLRWSTNTLWIKTIFGRSCMNGQIGIVLDLFVIHFLYACGDCNSPFSIYPAIQLQLVISAVPITSERAVHVYQFHTCEMGVHWMNIWTILLIIVPLFLNYCCISTLI